MKQGWEIKRLGDCFKSIRNGVTIKQERGAIGIPITRIETLSGGVFNRDRLGYANIQSTEKYSSYVLDDGDLLLSHINSKTYIGRTVVYNKLGDEEIIHGMNLLRLKAIREILSPYYAFYCFKSDVFKYQIASYRKDAVNQSSIPASDLKKISIPVPPLPIQNRIVSELDCLSGIIEKKKEQLKELDAIAQSIFYEMFGDPVENEKGWEVKKLGEVATSELGKMLDSKKNQGDFHPYLCTINVLWNQIDCTLIREMRIEDSELERYKIQKGDLLICEGGDTGRCAIWKNDDEIYYQNALHRVRFDEKQIIPIVCLYTMKFYKEYGEIDKYSTGQTIKHLVKKALLTIPLILPPLSLQQQFASKIEAIEKQKELIKKSIEDVEMLFNSRMEYYFN